LTKVCLFLFCFLAKTFDFFFFFEMHSSDASVPSAKLAASSYIAQIFLRFHSTPNSDAAPGDGSTCDASLDRSQLLAQKGSVNIPDPDFPVILRFLQTCNAAEATVAALKSYYESCWKEKCKRILRETEEKFGLALSKDSAVRLFGSEVADEVPTRQSQPSTKLPSSAKASSGVSTSSSTSPQSDDPAIEALLKQEELFFYQEVLPSRFVDDYTVFVALSDGSLPKKDVGALSSSQPYAEQQTEAHDTAEQRLLRPADNIRSHPRMVFPFSLAVHYRPTKKSRTVNDIIRRSSSVVFDTKGSGPRKSITTLDESVRHVLSTLTRGGGEQSPLQVVSDTVKMQSQPKTMIDDESAVKRGFTVLPFLPPLLNDAMQLKQKEMEAKAKAKEAAKEAVVAPPPTGNHLDATEVEVSVEALMKQCGLTEYDAARFGSGPFAAQCKDSVVQKSSMYAADEVRRRREENILRLERQQQERDQAAMSTSLNRELSLRQQFAKQQEEQRVKAARTAMDRIREQDANEVEKHSRALQAERLIKEFKQDAMVKLREDAERQKKLHASIEEELRAKTWRRLYDTTLEGEREKAAALARQRGALSTCLAEFRPKLKQMDQEARQDTILRNAVKSLDDKCDQQLSAQDSNLKKSLMDRKWHDTLVAEQQIVRAADADAHRNKTQDRTLRVADRERQAELLKRDHSEVNVMRLVRNRPMKEYFDDRTIDNSEELQQSFEKWRDDVRMTHEVALARKELHIHHK
jgi:hypothetical protein